MIDNLKNLLDDALHSDWVGTALTAVMIVVVTAILAHIVTLVLRKLLHISRNPLPSLSIFINIGRIVVWCIGICIVLSSCFGVNVSAAVTALGIGGLAVSLGFQNTLSNLIGGLQIILTKLIEPGDHVKIGNYEGIVHDVTWRHTTITTARGEQVIIPNANINTQALVRLAPETDVRIDIILKPTDENLSSVIKELDQKVSEALATITVVEKEPQISIYGSTEHGYKGLLSFTVAQGTSKSKAIDVALQAVSDHACKAKAPQPRETAMEKVIEGQKKARKRKMMMARKRRDSRGTTRHASAKTDGTTNAGTGSSDS